MEINGNLFTACDMLDKSMLRLVEEALDNSPIAAVKKLDTRDPLRKPATQFRGGLTGLMESSGKTDNFKTGDRWFTEPGHKVTLSNPGTVDHEHLFYTLVPTK